MQSDTPEFNRSPGEGLAEISGVDPQDLFERRYMTTLDIRTLIGVTTPAVHAAVRAARIPAPTVRVPGAKVWLWVRTAELTAALAAWHAEVTQRRAGAAQ